MSWRRESLLTNSTREPNGTVSSFGLTPLDVSVNVYGLDGFGVGAGVELPPPHDAASRHRRIARKTTPWHYPGARRRSQGAPKAQSPEPKAQSPRTGITADATE